MTTITIHQPEYLPYIGFFDRISKADIFIILDDVGYQKNGFMNRNKIKNSQGWQWITIPVRGRSPNKKVNEVLTDNKTDWAENQWKMIYFNYCKAPYFKEYSEFFKKTFEKKWDNLAELDIYLIKNIAELLGIKARIEKSSNLKIEGDGTDRLVNICKQFKADTYLSGPGGRDYMDLDKFKKENIEVVFQKFNPPEYSQMFMEKGFIPHLSIIDLLFNEGANSAKIINLGSNKIL